MLNRVPLLILGLICLGLSALAAVPNPINYQGQLTNSSGDPVPDGPYNITFTIYDHATLTTGHVLWVSGPHSITVNGGLINYLLGSNTPLPDDIMIDTTRYLGIRVGADPEISPRTKLTTVPFAYQALRADSVTNDPYVNETGDFLTGRLDFGSTGEKGAIYFGSNYSNLFLSTSAAVKSYLYGDGYGTLALRNGDGTETARLDATSAGGGQLYMDNSLDVNTVRLYGSTSAGGGLSLYGSGGNLRFIATAGSDGGLMTLYNLSNPWISFEADLNGDASVNFPDDAIASDEIKNEPGITVEDNNTIHTIASTTMQDLETVTITIPSDGYIVLTAKAWGRISGTIGSAGVYVQIDETSGGSATIPYYTFFGSTTMPSTANFYYPVFVQRAYQKTAGTYTFRLEASYSSGSSGTISIGDPILIATYYPTAYGTVNTFVSSSEAGQYENVEVMPATRQNGDQVETMENNYKVDLRELQLKAEKLRKELKQTEMLLRDQQRRQEMEAQQSPARDIEQ